MVGLWDLMTLFVGSAIFAGGMAALRLRGASLTVYFVGIVLLLVVSVAAIYGVFRLGLRAARDKRAKAHPLLLFLAKALLIPGSAWLAFIGVDSIFSRLPS